MSLYWGVRKKLITIMVLTMLPLLAVSVIITARLVEKTYSKLAVIYQSSLLERVTAGLNYLTRMAASDVSFLTGLASLETLAIADKSGAGGSAAYQRDYDLSLDALLGFMDSKGIYDQVRLLNATGMEVLRVNYEPNQAREVPAGELQDKSSRYYFREAAQLPAGKVFVSYVDLNREKGMIEKPHKPVVRFASPIRDSEGKLTGVIVLNFFVKELFKAAVERVRAQNPGIWMILDQEGYYVYHSRHPEHLWGSPRDLNTGYGCKQDWGDNCPDLLAGRMISLDVEGESWTAYSGVVSFPQNPQKSLTVVHLAPPPSFLVYVYHLGWALSIITALGVGSAMFLAWLSGQMVVRPLTELTQVMDRFSQHDWSARSGLSSHDELGALATGFNDMAKRLQGLYTDLESKVAERTDKLARINSLLERSEARTRAILDSTVDAIITIDSKGFIESFNRGAEQLFGYSTSEVLGRNVKMLQPPEVAARHDEYLQRYLETGKAQIIGVGREEWGKRKDGSIFPMYLAVSEVRLDETVLFTGIIRDITELREAEKSLKASQSLYKTLTEAAPVGIFYTDPEGGCTFVNDQWSEITGLGHEEARGQGWSQAIHPDDKKMVWEKWSLTAEKGAPFEAEYRFLRADGNITWVYGRAAAQNDADGNLLGYVGTITDITKNKLSEQALFESERYTKALFESSPIGLALCKMDGTLVEVNQAYADIIGRSVSETLGLTFWDITPRKYEAQEKAVIQDLEKYGRYEPYEKEYRHRDGHLVPVSLNGVLLNRGDEPYIWSVVEDITLRKQTEEENLTLGRILDESINEIYIFSVEDLHFLQVNQGARENLGYTMDELRQMTPLDIKPEMTADQFETQISPLHTGEDKRVGFDTVHQRKDGSTYPVEVNLQLSSHAFNQVFVAVIQDVTEKNKIQEELKRLSLVAERTDNAVIITDEKGKIQWVNEAFERITEYSLEEALGRIPGDLLQGPDTDPDTVSYMADMLAQGRGYRTEVVNYSKSGGQYWLSLDVQPVHSDAGEITNFVAVEHDITHRKTREQALREQAQIIYQIHDAVVSFDLSRRITSWNRGAEMLFGYPKEEAIGREITMVHVEKDRPNLQELIFDPLEKSGRHELELELRTKDGTGFQAFLSLSVLRNLSDEPTGFVGYAVDITERKRAEEAIHQAKEAAEAASRTKSDFLANMSHELRTPLNAIIGFSEILLDQTFGELNEKQSRQTGHILDSGRHLLAVINDILDISKVESGKMELELSILEPTAILASSIGLIKEKAGKHGIGLEFDIDESDDDYSITADERKLKQIMFNLLSNATKFTPDGGRIIVSVEREPDRIKVGVTDNGVGIDPEDQERIFGEFEQVDSTYARQQQGTGLGLALTRKLVELHGGRVWVESEGEGRGSAFFFTIPRDPVDSPVEDRVVEAKGDASSEAGPADFRSTILVIDDDPMARELLTGYLDEGGYKTITAANGTKGLEMAKSALPFAIALDVKLPDISGFEVLRQLKEDESTAGIPVIIVSITGERHKGLSLGAAEVLQKPINKEDLYEALPDLAGCTSKGFRKVLVVDDNPADVELVEELLETRGCRVIKAVNGAEGIEKTLEKRPDLIILDLDMPEVSGWDFLENLNEQTGEWRPPIVVFTSTVLSSEERRELSGQVQAMVIKDGGKEELLHEIDRLTKMTFEGS